MDLTPFSSYRNRSKASKDSTNRNKNSMNESYQAIASDCNDSPSRNVAPSTMQSSQDDRNQLLTKCSPSCRRRSIHIELSQSPQSSNTSKRRGRVAFDPIVEIIPKCGITVRRPSYERLQSATTSATGGTKTAVTFSTEEDIITSAGSQWYSSDEVASFEEEVNQLALHYRKHRMDYVECALDLLSRCNNPRIDDTGCGKRCVTGCCDAKGSRDNCLQRHPFPQVLMGDDTARGLERRIVAVLEGRRRRTIRVLLEQQDRLFQDKNLSTSQRQHLLASQYQRSCSTAQLWANVLASADAERLHSHHSSSPADECSISSSTESMDFF